MPITYIMCIAGEGTRFQPIFGDLPKPLIKLKRRTMLEWSLQSLPLMADDRIVFIAQKKHRLREKQARTIENLYPFCSIVWHEIDKVTRGQLETALFAEAHSLPESPIVIYNCDTYFQSKSLLSLYADSSIDGIIPCAKEGGDSWSFCAVDCNNCVVGVKEKERISEWASVGFYYFRSGKLFFDTAKRFIDNADCGECYVAPLYEDYIKIGMRVVMDPVHLFKPMGSPEQLEIFWNTTAAQVSAENNQRVLVIDLDGTITKEDPAVLYAEKEPNVAVINKMREFFEHGWKIVIYTSRRMQTCNNDESLVIANIGMITQQWLHDNNVPYHGLKFGKPYAHNGFYVDDKAMLIENFLRFDLVK